MVFHRLRRKAAKITPHHPQQHRKQKLSASAKIISKGKTLVQRYIVLKRIVESTHGAGDPQEQAKCNENDDETHNIVPHAEIQATVARRSDCPSVSRTTELTATSTSSTVSSVSSAASSFFLPDEHEDVQIDEKLYWGPIPNISDWRIRKLVLRLLGPTHGWQCWVSDKKNGSYNHVFVVQFRSHVDAKVCLKIPATGWDKRWTPEDAADLRREALTLRYIRRRLGDAFPSPDLLAYDNTIHNEIGAPFILMTCLEGKCGVETWCNLADAGNDGASDEVDRDDRRDRMLRSLAVHMAKMSTITFNNIGVLDFDDDSCNNPHIVPNVWSVMEMKDHDPQHPYKKTFASTKLFPNTREYFMSLLDRMEFLETSEERGRRKVLIEAIEGLPSSTSGCALDDQRVENFSLAHNDLDLQNVLCDDKGNITGILDWERVKVRPHSMGWSTMPMWLRDDVDAGRPWPFNLRRIHSPVELSHRRFQYARYLGQALGRYKDISSNEGEPWSYAFGSHLMHSLYNGLGYAADNLTPLRYFCDTVAKMAFPNTPPDKLYILLDRKARRSRDGGYKFLLEYDCSKDDLQEWMEQRISYIMRWGVPMEFRPHTYLNDMDGASEAEDGSDGASTHGSSLDLDQHSLDVECNRLSGSDSSHECLSDTTSIPILVVSEASNEVAETHVADDEDAPQATDIKLYQRMVVMDEEAHRPGEDDDLTTMHTELEYFTPSEMARPRAAESADEVHLPTLILKSGSTDQHTIISASDTTDPDSTKTFHLEDEDKRGCATCREYDLTDDCSSTYSSDSDSTVSSPRSESTTSTVTPVRVAATSFCPSSQLLCQSHRGSIVRSDHYWELSDRSRPTREVTLAHKATHSRVTIGPRKALRFGRCWEWI